MPCGTDYTGMWVGMKFIDAVRCPYQNTLGDAFPLIAILSIALAFLVFSEGRPMLPLVLLIMTGSVIMVLVPGSVVTTFSIVAVLMVAGGGYLLYRRASGGTV